MVLGILLTLIGLVMFAALALGPVLLEGWTRNDRADSESA